MPAVVKSSGDLLADRRYEYARSLAARGDAASAAALFAEAAAQAPHWPAAWRALGETRLALGDGEGAADAFRRCLALDPADEAGAALHLARIEHAPLPAIAPRAYVAALFDAYADEFDASLLARLDYRGHEIVAAAAAGRRYERALDLGCGTGLAGVLLKPLTDHLEGVDLSARMIEAARRRGVYDRLSIASLEERLAASEAEFDLIAAADVLCYMAPSPMPP
jgi:predicted TPR repeat methyltransferase